MEKTIDIKVKLEEKDLEDFFSHLAKQSIGMKLMVIFSLIIFVAQLIRVIVEPTALESGLIWILFVIFLFLLMLYSSKYNARRSFRHNKRLQAEYDYKIDEKGVKIKGDNANTSIPWIKIYRVTESKKSLFLWLNKKQAQIIPKRYLTADEATAIQMLKKLARK